MKAKERRALDRSVTCQLKRKVSYRKVGCKNELSNIRQMYR